MLLYSTALDAIEAGIPYITLPSEYLRGRMGQTYYRTMNIPELVAKNRSDYIHIALRCITDENFKSNVIEKILTRRYLIWEDMAVPFGWTQLLTRVMGREVMNWDTFIMTTGRCNII